MKTNVGLYAVTLDMPEEKISLKHANRILKKSARLLSLTFICLVAFCGLASAQSLASITTPVKSHRNGDIGDKFREEKREVREEKRSVRAVEDIPYKTKELFNTDFGNAKRISWMSPAGFDEADFTLKNSKMMAFFDFDSQLIGTGKFVTFNELPANAIAEIQKKYKDYVPEKIMFYDDNEANDTNLNLFGQEMAQDSYFAQMKDGSKQIVLQILRDGTVSYFSNFQ
jgi:hypothetical protein